MYSNTFLYEAIVPLASVILGAVLVGVSGIIKRKLEYSANIKFLTTLFKCHMQSILIAKIDLIIPAVEEVDRIRLQVINLQSNAPMQGDVVIRMDSSTRYILIPPLDVDYSVADISKYFSSKSNVVELCVIIKNFIQDFKQINVSRNELLKEMQDSKLPTVSQAINFYGGNVNGKVNDLMLNYTAHLIKSADDCLFFLYKAICELQECDRNLPKILRSKKPFVILDEYKKYASCRSQKFSMMEIYSVVIA